MLKYCLPLACSLIASFAQTTSNAFVAKIPASTMPSTVTVTATDAVAAPGKTLQIPLTLTSTTAPVSLQLDLAFDHQKLIFVSVQPSSNATASTITLPNGNVRLQLAAKTQSSIADGLAATLSFTASQSFSTTPLSLLNCSALSPTAVPLSTGCAPATIHALSCDGAATVADVQLLINESLGLMPPVHDLNQDGSVNLVDVQKEINAALGLGCALSA